MQTLQQRLNRYCSENKKEMPFGRHIDAISMAIITRIKEIDGYSLIKKKKETINVNNYPDKFVEIIDGVLKDYFENRNKFMRQNRKNSDGATIKYFNFDVESHKATSFEEALAILNIPVAQNFNQKGIAQYKIPVVPPPVLIKLGKTFQKQRWFQEKRERSEKLLNKMNK